MTNDDQIEQLKKEIKELKEENQRVLSKLVKERKDSAEVAKMEEFRQEAHRLGMWLNLLPLNLYLANESDRKALQLLIDKALRTKEYPDNPQDTSWGTDGGYG